MTESTGTALGRAIEDIDNCTDLLRVVALAMYGNDELSLSSISALLGTVQLAISQAEAARNRLDVLDRTLSN
jgi:hypothetical protein